MRGHSRLLSRGNLLLSVSVASFAAVRLLLKAGPRLLSGRRSAAFASAISVITGQSSRQIVGSFFLPSTYARAITVPVGRSTAPLALDMHTINSTRPTSHGSRISARLWSDCQLEAMQSLHHPWTLGLATGRTNHASFKSYIAQDAYFLRAFAKAYAYALTKTSDEEGVRAFHSLIGSVLDELGLHATYAATWGIDVHNIPPSVQATNDYVEFLLAVASDPSSTIAEVLASMAPCMRLYAFLGKELREAFPQWKESAYASWIETYSSEDFEGAASLIESLLDKYATSVDYALLSKLYRKAMNLEYAFFAAQNRGEYTATDSPTCIADTRCGADDKRLNGVHARVGLLCVDFDETITESDTLHLLVKIAMEKHPAERREVLTREWTKLTKAFLATCDEVFHEELDAKGSRCTSDGCTKMDREGLDMLLQRLEEADLDSVSRVSASQLLRGITRESIQESLAGTLRSHWNTRPGVESCMFRALASPFHTHVLSINWSQDIITSVLREALHAQDAYVRAKEHVRAPELTVSGLELGGSPVAVSANDIVYDDHGVSTGKVAISVRGSSGKLQRFLELAALAQDAAVAKCKNEAHSLSRSLTVYVGDSLTDLPAMLAADVGIIVGNNKSFSRVGDAFGLHIRPLVSAYENLRKDSDTQSSILYRASGWAEIDIFLFGVRRENIHTQDVYL